MKELVAPPAVAEDSVGRLPRGRFIPRFPEHARRQREGRYSEGCPVGQSLRVGAGPDAARSFLVHAPAGLLENLLDLAFGSGELARQLRNVPHRGENRLASLEVSALRDSESCRDDRSGLASDRLLQALWI